jgi:hypothetical protein
MHGGLRQVGVELHLDSVQKSLNLSKESCSVRRGDGIDGVGDGVCAATVFVQSIRHVTVEDFLELIGQRDAGRQVAGVGGSNGQDGGSRALKVARHVSQLVVVERRRNAENAIAIDRCHYAVESRPIGISNRKHIRYLL